MDAKQSGGMVGVDFFDRKPSLPSKIRGLPQIADSFLLFGNRLKNGHGNRQRIILRWASGREISDKPKALLF